MMHEKIEVSKCAAMPIIRIRYTVIELAGPITIIPLSSWNGH